MSDLQPYTSLLPSMRSSRSLARLSDETTVAAAVVQAKADVEAAKLDGISAVAGKAMQNVALLSSVEQSLAQTVPHASGRLATIADLASLAMADVVATAARRIVR